MTTRVAILGTAPSWRQCPWDDPGLTIASLNDAYSMGVPRIDEHYEQHPLQKMWFRPKGKRDFREDEIPIEVRRGEWFIRPEGHLEWLQAQAKTIPIWLQDEPPAGWPVNAKRFPIEDIVAQYGHYWASGPSYMLAHFHARGYRHFEIYGIHLATQREYLEQRPQWEHLLGRFLGPTVKERIADGKRIYEGTDCTVVLPANIPILQHPWQYGYEPRPVPPDAEAQMRLAKAQVAYNKLVKHLALWPRWKSKAAELDTLRRLKAEIADAQQQARHAVITAGKAA